MDHHKQDMPLSKDRGNKMGWMHPTRLLWSMSVPIMISMLVQALYNIVDSIYVAQISQDALTAVSLAFPWQNLMIAVAVGTAVGINAYLSRALGEKNQSEVRLAAMNGLFLAFCSFVVFGILGVILSNPFFAMQTDVESIVGLGDTYMYIISLFSFGMFFQVTFERLLNSTGKTMLSMCSQGLGALINLVLDPILIFGWLGFPSMGVAGAAIATVTGQIVAACVGLGLNLRFNREIQLSWHHFTLSKRVIGQIYVVGLPSIVMQAVSSVMTFMMNGILLTFSTTAATVFGIYYKLQSFVFMPLFGMNNGMVPIIAYNYGAQKPERILKVFHAALLSAAGIMALGTLICMLFPSTLLYLFNASEDLMAQGIPALRIISTSFILASVSVVAMALFQAMGHGMYSLWVALIRQLVVLTPIAWLLSLTRQLDLVWLSFPIAEVVSVLVSLYFIHVVKKKQIIPMMHENKKELNA